MTTDLVRARWGAGEYRVHWLLLDAEHTEVGKRRQSQGNGVIFKLDPEPVATTVPHAPPASPHASITVAPSDPSAMIHMFLQLQEMSDKRAERSIASITSLIGLHPQERGPAIAVPPEVSARLAALETELAVEKALRAANEKHAAEIAELHKKHAEETEGDDDDRADTGLSFSPDGGSIWTQLGYGVLNAAAKKPELVAAIASPIMAAMQGGAPPAAPPRPPAPVRPPPRALHGDLSNTHRTDTSPVVTPPPGAQDDGSVNSHMPSAPMGSTVSVPVVGANGAHRAPAQAPPLEVDAADGVT